MWNHVDQLKENVLKSITTTLERPTVEKEHAGIPLLVGKTVDHQFSDKKYRGTVISLVPGFP